MEVRSGGGSNSYSDKSTEAKEDRKESFKSRIAADKNAIGFQAAYIGGTIDSVDGLIANIKNLAISNPFKDQVKDQKLSKEQKDKLTRNIDKAAKDIDKAAKINVKEIGKEEKIFEKDKGKQLKAAAKEKSAMMDDKEKLDKKSEMKDLDKGGGFKNWATGEKRIFGKTKIERTKTSGERVEDANASAKIAGGKELGVIAGKDELSSRKDKLDDKAALLKSTIETRKKTSYDIHQRLNNARTDYDKLLTIRDMKIDILRNNKEKISDDNKLVIKNEMKFIKKQISKLQKLEKDIKKSSFTDKESDLIEDAIKTHTGIINNINASSKRINSILEKPGERMDKWEKRWENITSRFFPPSRNQADLKSSYEAVVETFGFTPPSDMPSTLPENIAEEGKGVNEEPLPNLESNTASVSELPPQSTAFQPNVEESSTGLDADNAPSEEEQLLENVNVERETTSLSEAEEASVSESKPEPSRQAPQTDAKSTSQPNDFLAEIRRKREAFEERAARDNEINPGAEKSKKRGEDLGMFTETQRQIDELKKAQKEAKDSSEESDDEKWT